MREKRERQSSITVALEGEEHFVVLGTVRKPISTRHALALGSLLRAPTIESIADGDAACSAGPWAVQSTENERARDFKRRRLLLCFGEQTWHIERDEALQLGNLLRSVVG